MALAVMLLFRVALGWGQVLVVATGCQWGKAGLGTDGHSPGLTAETLRGRGIEESGEKTSLGKGVDGSKVVI